MLVELYSSLAGRDPCQAILMSGDKYLIGDIMYSRQELADIHYYLTTLEANVAMVKKALSENLLLLEAIERELQDKLYA